MQNLEVWLRGPLEGYPKEVQAIAHALLQAREELNIYLDGFPTEKLWEKPYGVASVGFHLKHLTGVLDRLFTYANGDQLSEIQMVYLKSEGEGKETVNELINHFNIQVDRSLDYLKNIKTAQFYDIRLVGRKEIPSTFSGLLFHAAEHTQRHVGQLLVTSKILHCS